MDVGVRYVIPAIATVTGVTAWVLAGNVQGSDSTDGLAFLPDDPLAPVTNVYEVPQVPELYFFDEPDIKTSGVVACDRNSKRSPLAVTCLLDKTKTLDPCYYPYELEGEPYVFCLKPEYLTYDLYEVSSISGEQSEKGSSVEMLIYVQAPDREPIAGSFDNLIELDSGYHDACLIDDYKVPKPIDRTYTCLSGSKVAGGVLGEKPNYFVKYWDAETDTTSSQWLGLVVYG